MRHKHDSDWGENAILILTIDSLKTIRYEKALLYFFIPHYPFYIIH